eukprot:14331365-Alexandrium_andersonii.AAC.1
MSASLVGSEMCIRDRCGRARRAVHHRTCADPALGAQGQQQPRGDQRGPSAGVGGSPRRLAALQ